MNTELLEIKKPRFKNRGLSCGPIKASGLNRVDLSLITFFVILFKTARLETILVGASLETFFSKKGRISRTKIELNFDFDQKTSQYKININN